MYSRIRRGAGALIVLALVSACSVDSDDAASQTSDEETDAAFIPAIDPEAASPVSIALDWAIDISDPVQLSKASSTVVTGTVTGIERVR